MLLIVTFYQFAGSPFVRLKSLWFRIGPMAGIAALGLLLRLATLGDRSLQMSETYALQAVLLSPSELLTPPFIDGGNMLLFYLIGHFYVSMLPTIPPVSEFLLRLLPAMLSVATVPAFYLLGTRVAQHLSFGPHDQRKVGLTAALLLAVSPFSITYAQFFRAYSLQLLLITVASLALFSYVSTDHSRFKRGHYLGVYVVCAALSIYAHMLGAIFIAGQGLCTFALMLFRSRRREGAQLAVSGLAIALLLVPLLATVTKKGAGQIEWIHPLKVSTMGRTIAELFGGTHPDDVKALLLMLPLALLFAVGIVVLLRKRSRAEPLAAILIVPMFLMLATFAVFSMTVVPIWVDRYFHLLLLPICISAAFGANLVWSALRGAEAKRPTIRAVAFSTLLIACSLSTTFALRTTLLRPARDDWKSAAPFINSQCAAETTVRIFSSHFQGYLNRSLFFYQVRPGNEVRTTSFVMPKRTPGESLCLVMSISDLERYSPMFSGLATQLQNDIGPMKRTVFRNIYIYTFEARD